jgi:hypothetical protein
MAMHKRCARIDHGTPSMWLSRSVLERLDRGRWRDRNSSVNEGGWKAGGEEGVRRADWASCVVSESVCVVQQYSAQGDWY